MENLQDLKNTVSEIDEVFERLKAADEWESSPDGQGDNEKSEDQLEDERNRDDQAEAERGGRR